MRMRVLLFKILPRHLFLTERTYMSSLFSREALWFDLFSSFVISPGYFQVYTKRAAEKMLLPKFSWQMTYRIKRV